MNISDIQPNRIFVSRKNGGLVKVRWDWTDFAKTNGYVQFTKVDEDGKKVGPLLSSKFSTFVKNYAAR